MRSKFFKNLYKCANKQLKRLSISPDKRNQLVVKKSIVPIICERKNNR
jgi:hypothetical protein